MSMSGKKLGIALTSLVLLATIAWASQVEKAGEQSVKVEIVGEITSTLSGQVFSYPDTDKPSADEVSGRPAR